MDYKCRLSDIQLYLRLCQIKWEHYLGGEVARIPNPGGGGGCTCASKMGPRADPDGYRNEPVAGEVGQWVFALELSDQPTASFLSLSHY